MHCLLVFTCLLALVWGLQKPIGLDGVVSWDKYSLKVNGERVFIFAGEFHYQRLPVPELWDDIFEKFKAHGLNAVSIYFFWSYHSPSRDVLDLETGAHNITRLLDAAARAGLWVIARPGPYCNAETSAGGLPGWVSGGGAGKQVRTADDAAYSRAWRPWVRQVGAVLAGRQVSRGSGGGPVLLVQLENEFAQGRYGDEQPRARYMIDLKAEFRGVGVSVPLTHNEAGMRGISWSSDYMNPTKKASVDIYGLDSYPGGLGCGAGDRGFKVPRSYYHWFSNYSFTQPSYMPEFEAGWFMPWGGQFYDQCRGEHEPSFADVFYKNNVAQRTTLLALYMAYGGTSWGQSAAPVVYTSYDYSAPIRETRQIQDKFRQTKLLALFTRVSSDLLKTEMEDYGEGKAVDTKLMYTWILHNPDTKARFYTLQQTDSRSKKRISATMTFRTTKGDVSVSDVTLDGRQSKILVTDYQIGKAALLFCSAEILTYGLFDSPAVVLYLKEGQHGTFALRADTNGDKFETFGAPVNFKATSSKTSTGEKFTRYDWSQPSGRSVVRFSSGLAFILLDVKTAWKFYAPSTTVNPNPKPDQHIFVIGPHLVRSASVLKNEVRIIGDSDGEANVEVFPGDHAVTHIVWNNKPLPTTRTGYGSLVAKLGSIQGRKVSLPTLSSWKTADSLPERDPAFNDSRFVLCTKNSSISPVAALTRPVLHTDDYGFHTGIKVYRGRFDGRGGATRARLTVQGGTAAGWSSWLNGASVGGHRGAGNASSSTVVLDLVRALRRDGDNVLTVLVDDHGHDQGAVKPAGPGNPRGIRGAALLAADGREVPFREWRVQGNAGGEAAVDAVRGPLNEGGLYGERAGWHLPGFDVSRWREGGPLEGIKGAGVAWYVTNFDLDIDADLDVPIGIELDAPPKTVARVQIFINGYQYGKYIPHIGPQTRFPFQPGLINTKGSNTLVISLWAQEEAGARLSAIRLIEYGKYETGFNFSRNWSYLQPAWSKERLRYV